MKKTPQPPATSAEIRRRAEARLRERTGSRGQEFKKTKSEVDAQRLLHELQVHRVELEMQNTELRQARNELEAALENYTDLYDFAPVAYFTLAADSTIKLANLTGASLVGLERSRLLGRPFGELIAAELRPVFHSFLKKVFAGKDKQTGEFPFLRQEKAIRTVNINAQRLPSGQECRVVVVDITERKQAEDKVRVSEIRYRRLFEAAHDGVLLLDPVTRKITDANPFMTLLLGYPRDQLIGKELYEIGLLQDEGASQEMFRKLKRQHQVRYEDLPLESKRGRLQEVEVVANLYLENDHPVIQCNIRDITERKRAEEAQRRLDFLTASNKKLELEIVRRKAVELALKKSERDLSRLLLRSHYMQNQLRGLSHQILKAQEEERKLISRELHDEVAQVLVGINLHLTGLMRDAGGNPKSLQASIAHTQQLVEKSVSMVHDFARELRPAVLDDLGLIPALRTVLKTFNTRHGIRTRLAAFPGVEQLDATCRTVLFRVAQEALTNVARHAKAGRVVLSIRKLEEVTRMEIKDDGKSFHVERTLKAKGNKRLGLLGMRERVEMIGGTFSVESSPGKGTTVRVDLPPPAAKASKKRDKRSH